MLSKKIVKMLNEQINKELYSAYLYLDFSNYLTEHGLPGYANWYRIQALEERDHAMLMYDYLHMNNVQVVFEAIDKPVFKAEGVKDVIKEALKHEQLVTSWVHDIYAAAQEEKDFRTTQFLDWFVKEQGEEEANAQDIVTRTEVFGSDPKGLYLMDQELAGRTYVAPSLVL